MRRTGSLPRYDAFMPDIPFLPPLGIETGT